MLQNFTNYLLSSVLNQNPPATPEAVDTSSIRTRTAEESDWVLVDRDSEGNINKTALLNKVIKYIYIQLLKESTTFIFS